MTNCQKKCFISLIIEALEIKKKFKLYNTEKKNAKAGNENTNVNNCSCTEFSGYDNSLIPSPDSEEKDCFFKRLFVEDSIQNFILKSVFGFIGGILLTYICFMFLVFSLNFTLKRATYICTCLGVILSLGLAFSVKIRCTVFLCLPQLFSKRGRQALLAYAFILALSGPAKNTLHNVEVMSESLACGQEQLKQAENELLKCVQKPNAAAKKSIDKMLERINSAVKDFKNFLLQFYRNCFDILETVLHAQKWLYSISLLCHRKMGRPTERCLTLLSESIENCESIHGMIPCHIGRQSAREICYSDAKAFCMNSDVPPALSVFTLEKQLNGFIRRAMNILFVRIDAHQTYSQSNRTYTYHEEYQGMATEIRQKTDQFLQYFDFMSVIFGIFILVLFVKVIIYRHKFLTEDHYDNRYITPDFVDIDNTRAEFQMETLLPLEPRERLKYIKVTCIRLLPCERVRLFSSFVFLIFATFKIIIHMLTDSSLYWILSTVRRNEKLLYMSQVREEEPSITVRVAGDGLVAALFRNVSRAVKRQSSPRLDPTPCLPDPIAPDWNRYYQILTLVILCWLLAICEPYGLRLRHTVMVTYHPDRARERAIWLYNRIISDRTSFVKVTRRKLRRKYRDAPPESVFRFRFMRRKKPLKCLLCKVKITEKDKGGLACPTSDCVGIFCGNCFGNLKCCSICSDPTEYGDLSDVSEEKDSSEDESPRECRREAKAAPKSVRMDDAAPLIPPREEEPQPKDLIQPALLLTAVNYCRSKIPALKKTKNPSDVESSDWDLDSTARTEKSHSSFRTERSRKSKRKGRSLEKLGDRVSVRLFRKISLGEGLSQRTRGTIPSPKDRRTAAPDFLFRTRGVKARLEEFREEEVFEPFWESDEKVVFKASSKDKETQTGTPESSLLWCLSQCEAIRPAPKDKKFPFVDPINVHEFDSLSSLSEASQTREVAMPSFRAMTSRARVCYQKSFSSDSLGGQDVRLCLRSEASDSSAESDAQFYAQSYRQVGTETSEGVRRTPAALSLKVNPRKNLYSVETDSSNDKFLSAKPIRKVKRFFKKSATERKPKTFSSEEEFEKPPRKKNPKQKSLSWAPDLCSTGE